MVRKEIALRKIVQIPFFEKKIVRMANDSKGKLFKKEIFLMEVIILQ